MKWFFKWLSLKRASTFIYHGSAEWNYGQKTERNEMKIILLFYSVLCAFGIWSVDWRLYVDVECVLLFNLNLEFFRFFVFIIIFLRLSSSPIVTVDGSAARWHRRCRRWFHSEVIYNIFISFDIYVTFLPQINCVLCVLLYLSSPCRISVAVLRMSNGTVND